MSRLPLPSFITESCRKDDEQDCNDSDALGRVRSYPHVCGQWTTFIYAEVSCNALDHLTDYISSYGTGIELVDDIHLSLVRGHYALTFHQITPFINALRNKLSNCQPFDVYLSTFKLFTNDECTRYFICLCEPKLQIDSINTRASRLGLDIINTALDDFNCRVKSCQAKQMKQCDNSTINDFIFHTSLAWCLPEQQESARMLISQLDELMDDCIKININKIKVTIGNICHTIDLKST